MDLMMVPIISVIAGSIAVVGIAAVVHDYKKKELELSHKEKIMKLEIEKLKLEKEIQEKK